ncbi:MAG: hypothetical protein WAU14_07990, partial [Dokdonella sp.]|uniref:hypothetical protein n=1 Tax=Dokdonella sp. TaxID=2291710 RepID=UPI003BAF85CC
SRWGRIERFDPTFFSAKHTLPAPQVAFTAAIANPLARSPPTMHHPPGVGIGISLAADIDNAKAR